MDFFLVLVDAAALAALALALLLGSKAIRGFRQSRQAVAESASLLDIIVRGLTSRVERSETVVREIKSEFGTVSERSSRIEGEQTSLRTSYLQVLRHIQEMMATDKRLILEIERLKTSTAPAAPVPAIAAPEQQARQGPASQNGDVLASLTPTERHTLEILVREGPKAAPELGRRLRKSREHTARLMKKLYMEGYVDRESNHAPYRYRLNEKVRLVLQEMESRFTVKASGTA